MMVPPRACKKRSHLVEVQHEKELMEIFCYSDNETDACDFRRVEGLGWEM